MTETQHNTVFISYRRDVSSFIARAIFLDLRANGYDVFMDVEDADAGMLDTIIMNQIAARAHFLIILTPGTLDRCRDPNDMLRREIELAIALKRNVIPILVNDFHFDDVKRYLTGKLENLSNFSGLSLPHDYFNAAMERLRSRFLKQPVVGAIEPAPLSEQPRVNEKIAEAAAEPAPTQAQLSAEQYVLRAKNRAGDDYQGKIDDYSRAIQLNPQYARAYLNRGIARRRSGDIKGAIEDYNRVIELNPRIAEAYFDRGIARSHLGDLQGELADYRMALKVDPNNGLAYGNMGEALRLGGDLRGAIDAFDRALQIRPNEAMFYNNRGLAHLALGEVTRAISDFEQALTLAPLGDKLIHVVNGNLHRAHGDLHRALGEYEAYLRGGGGKLYSDEKEVEGWIRDLQSQLNDPN